MSTVQRIPRLAMAMVGALAIVALAACNGATNSVLGGVTGKAYVRVLQGSPDAGNVEFGLDGNTTIVGGTSYQYGGITGYTQVAAGPHSISVFASGQTGGAPMFTTSAFAVSAGSDYTVVIGGELHPSDGATPGLVATVFAEQPFNTSGGAAVNFHHASPAMSASGGYNESSVQFGYSLDATPSNQTIGLPIPMGQMTGPQVLPSGAVNTPITFYANSNTSITATPGQLSSQCSNNDVPCSTPNLSLYLIDGPGASTSPQLPPGYGTATTAKAIFVGAFDANGFLTQSIARSASTH